MSTDQKFKNNSQLTEEPIGSGATNGWKNRGDGHESETNSKENSSNDPAMKKLMSFGKEFIKIERQIDVFIYCSQYDSNESNKIIHRFP